VGCLAKIGRKRRTPITAWLRATTGLRPSVPASRRWLHDCSRAGRVLLLPAGAGASPFPPDRHETTH
jgi:hypothetical protein